MSLPDPSALLGIPSASRLRGPLRPCGCSKNQGGCRRAASPSWESGGPSIPVRNLDILIADVHAESWVVLWARGAVLGPDLRRSRALSSGNPGRSHPSSHCAGSSLSLTYDQHCTLHQDGLSSPLRQLCFPFGNQCPIQDWERDTTGSGHTPGSVLSGPLTHRLCPWGVSGVQALAQHSGKESRFFAARVWEQGRWRIWS